ncbi:MAG TPA: hypothetical protein VM049_07310 [Gaiellaceae bacterium]|nr:hypothetical protein [Gaiellaceae bacterium]
MNRSRLATGALAMLVALAAIAFFIHRGSNGNAGLRPLRAHAALSDRIVIFGDTIRARLEITFDRRQIDPAAIRVRATFAAWRRVAPARTTRVDAGSSSLLEITYVLRCLKQACAPERETLPFQFDPARVDFVNRGGGRGGLKLEWPRLVVHSRFQPGDLAKAAPWRLDDTTVPPPSYRAAPGLVLAALLAGSLLLLSTGGLLAYVGWPRRQVAPEPEPEPEPELLLTPLERALELLEQAAGANGAADQRRSLELVAEVLAERGEEDGLARTARELAWSPVAPPPAATKGLAARVRAALEEELRLLEQERLAEEERRRAAEEAHARVD